MDDLVEWLKRQLDDDEASEWPHRPSCQMVKQPGLSCNCDAADRWRRDIDAKRRILRAWQHADEVAREPNGELVVATRYGIEIALRALALPYSDRPGYQEEWRP